MLNATARNVTIAVRNDLDLKDPVVADFVKRLPEEEALSSRLRSVYDSLLTDSCSPATRG